MEGMHASCAEYRSNDDIEDADDNTDSNDKMKEGRRPSQEDSPLKVGVRANSQGWDLFDAAITWAMGASNPPGENIKPIAHLYANPSYYIM